MVPFEGFEDGLTGRERPQICEAVSSGGEAASFHRGKPCRSIGNNFSKRRSKNVVSLKGKRCTGTTALFGDKLLLVGKNNLGKPSARTKKRKRARGFRKASLYRLPHRVTSRHLTERTDIK